MDEETLNQAIELSRSGRTMDARKLLRPLLEVEPENEKAWLWYANSFDSVEEKIKVLKNCLLYCPDSKKVNDGIRALQAALPHDISASGVEASGLAADLQKENVQFTESDETQGADQKTDIEFSRPATSSPFHDNLDSSTIEQRLQGTLQPDNIAKNSDFTQKGIVKFAPDTGYMDSPFLSENGAIGNNVQIAEKGAAPSRNEYPSHSKFRTPFIVLTVFGVILLLILGVIVTILVFS
jgi:hypothetical protein